MGCDFPTAIRLQDPVEYFDPTGDFASPYPPWQAFAESALPMADRSELPLSKVEQIASVETWIIIGEGGCSLGK